MLRVRQYQGITINFVMCVPLINLLPQLQSLFSIALHYCTGLLKHFCFRGSTILNLFTQGTGGPLQEAGAFSLWFRMLHFVFVPFLQWQVVDAAWGHLVVQVPQLYAHTVRYLGNLARQLRLPDHLDVTFPIRTLCDPDLVPHTCSPAWALGALRLVYCLPRDYGPALACEIQQISSHPLTVTASSPIRSESCHV